MYNIHYTKINKGGIVMNQKIIEKLKDAKFLEQIIGMSDEKDVKEAFKKEGLEITDEDLKEVRDLIAVSMGAISQMPEEELEEIAGGYGDGVVDKLSGKLDSMNIGGENSFISKNSDKIVEAGLAATLIAGAVGGTIGIQKLIKSGNPKKWWQDIKMTPQVIKMLWYLWRYDHPKFK